MQTLLEAMALDPRMYRGLSYGTGCVGAFGGFESTASAPSLRASEPLAAQSLNMADKESANVKVVVRVRQFLKRGDHISYRSDARGIQD